MVSPSVLFQRVFVGKFLVTLVTLEREGGVEHLHVVPQHVLAEKLLLTHIWQAKFGESSPIHQKSITLLNLLVLLKSTVPPKALGALSAPPDSLPPPPLLEKYYAEILFFKAVDCSCTSTL